MSEYNKRYQEAGYRVSPERHFLPLNMGSPPALQGQEIPLIIKKGEKIVLV